MTYKDDTGMDMPGGRSDATRSAAQRASETAARTGTALHVVRAGNILELLPVREQGMLREDAADYRHNTP